MIWPLSTLANEKDEGMNETAVSDAARKRITAALFLSQSLFSAAMIAAFTLMPILAADLSGSDTTAGVPNTLTLLGRAAAAYPVGWLMDRAGRRLGLSLGFGFSVVGSLVAVWAVLAGSFLWFCAGALLVGFGRSASEQTRYVAAEVQPQAQRAKVIGFIVFAGTIGAIGGPLLVEPSGVWAARLDLTPETGPFLFSAVLYAVALLITVLLLHPDPLHVGVSVAAAERPLTDITAPAATMREIFARPLVQLAVASMVIGQLVMVMIMTITPLHMDHQHHATQAISLVIMAHTLGMFGLSSVTGWLIDRYGRILMIVLGALVLIASSIMTPLVSGVPLLAAALFLLGLGWNFCFVAGSSLLSDALGAHERGRIQGASEVLVALAAGAGSLSTGGVFAQGGMMAVSAVGLAFSLVLVALLVWQRRSGGLSLAEAARSAQGS